MIFVCAGAEYQALKKGLKQTHNLHEIIKLPIGVRPVHELLNKREIIADKALLIGLGGSLSPDYKVGDVVIYQSCCYFNQDNNLVTKFCDNGDSKFSDYLSAELNLPLVKGFTSNFLVNSYSQKISLQEKSGCDVVDMESFALMSYISELTVVRIISDNYHDNLPNLNSAINEQGKLDNVKMTIAFLQQPLSAINLIKNSLYSLKKLEEISSKIVNIYQNFE